MWTIEDLCENLDFGNYARGLGGSFMNISCFCVGGLLVGGASFCLFAIYIIKHIRVGYVVSFVTW